MRTAREAILIEKRSDENAAANTPNETSGRSISSIEKIIWSEGEQPTVTIKLRAKSEEQISQLKKLLIEAGASSVVQQRPPQPPTNTATNKRRARQRPAVYIKATGIDIFSLASFIIRNGDRF